MKKVWLIALLCGQLFAQTTSGGVVTSGKVKIVANPPELTTTYLNCTFESGSCPSSATVTTAINVGTAVVTSAGNGCGGSDKYAETTIVYSGGNPDHGNSYISANFDQSLFNPTIAGVYTSYCLQLDAGAITMLNGANGQIKFAILNRYNPNTPHGASVFHIAGPQGANCDYSVAPWSSFSFYADAITGFIPADDNNGTRTDTCTMFVPVAGVWNRVAVWLKRNTTTSKGTLIVWFNGTPIIYDTSSNYGHDQTDSTNADFSFFGSANTQALIDGTAKVRIDNIFIADGCPTTGCGK